MIPRVAAFVIMISILVVTTANAAPFCSELFVVSPTKEAINTALLSSKSIAGPIYLRSSMNELIQKSYDHPVEIGSGEVGSGINIMLYHGNIFTEGYFRRTRLKALQNSTASLIETQPWFEWNAHSNQYIQRNGHTEHALLGPEIIDHKVKLYRGLNLEQAILLKKLKIGQTDVIDKLFTEHRDAMFFTTDRESAVKWSKGYYIEITLSEKDLDKVYTGIEFDYVEIAIPSRDILQRAIGTLKVTKAVNPRRK